MSKKEHWGPVAGKCTCAAWQISKNDFEQASWSLSRGTCLKRWLVESPLLVVLSRFIVQMLAVALWNWYALGCKL